MKNVWTIAVLGVAMVGCAGQVGAEGEQTEASATPLSAKCAPAVPAVLAVPDGNKLRMQFDAVGVQIYACTQTSPSAYTWVFRAPQATLYNAGGQVAGTHYAGPTWQADDGTTVVGAKLAAYTADATSIPWLLLKAASHAGDGRMTPVTYVQRLDTVGGIAPTTGCDAQHVGAIANVDYTATYFFYEASQGTDDPGNCP
jgi:hypothetical protein